MKFGKPPVGYELHYKKDPQSFEEIFTFWTTSDLMALQIAKDKIAKEGQVVTLYNKKSKTYLVDRRNIKKELDEISQQIEQIREALTQSIGLPKGYLSHNLSKITNAN